MVQKDSSNHRGRFATLLLIVGGVALLGILGGGAVSAQGGTTAALVGLPTNQIIIQYKRNATAARAAATSQAQMDRLSAAAGVELTYFREMSGDAHVLKLPGYEPLVQVELAAARLAVLPEIEYAQPDYINLPVDDPLPSGTAATPNDTLYGSQWDFTAPVPGSYGVNMPTAWDLAKGNSGLRVAVIDTGLLVNHPDLSGMFAQGGGYDMISNTTAANDGDGRDADPSDPGDWHLAGECGDNSNSSWHGTHVVGTIAANSNNSQGVAGINWFSKVQTVRVLGKCGGNVSDIADGMRWAAGLAVPGVPDNANPSRVMNLSLGGASSCPPSYQTAIDDARAKNVVVVVAAGNSNVDAGGFSPANCDGVITVAATDQNGNRSIWNLATNGASNFGSTVEISAPGTGILSTLNDGATTPNNHTYVNYNGTSMAAPHVAGIVSLMLSQSPTLTPDQVLASLQNTVTNFPGGSTCTTSICGSGIINARGALFEIDQTPINYLVKTLDDSNDGLCELAPGDCTLREAILAANGTSVFDAIRFAQDGTILLTLSLPPITKSLTLSGAIVGGGTHSIVIDGDAKYRVLEVNTQNVTLNYLTIQNGFANTSLEYGTSGGAIYNRGILTVLNTTFKNNSAPTYGGAILNQGIATIANSTFTGNSATALGGGIESPGTSTLKVYNSTFSGNSSPQGAGLQSDNSLTLVNTIIANSTGPDCSVFGTIVTEKNNLIESTGGSACGLVNGANGDKIGVDPKLVALADNGGATQTMALDTGSPAIDSGDNSTCSNSLVNGLDQRNFVRPVDGDNNGSAICDIGAFEAPEAAAPTATPTSTSTPVNVPANNDFANAQNIAGTSDGLTGSTFNADKESGEPDHGGIPGGASVWYRWTAPVSGSETFDTNGSGFDTLLGVYTGNSVGGLTAVTGNDDCVPPDTSSCVTFDTAAGTTYMIAVDGFNGGSGGFHLNWTGAAQTATPTATNTRANTPTRTRTPTRTATATPTTGSCTAKPGKPKLKQPGNNTTATSSKVKLKWRAAACATDYQVIVKNIATGKKVFKKTLTKSKVKTGVLPGGSYKWFVKARNTAGTTKSVKFKFSK